MIDYVQSVVGDVMPGTDHVHLGLQRPEVGLRDPATGNIIDRVRSDVPDLLSLHGKCHFIWKIVNTTMDRCNNPSRHLVGTLPESNYIAQNASLVAYFARGQPYPGESSLVWTLNCEKGTIRLNSPSGIALGANAYESPVTISVHHFDTDKVEQIEWSWSEAQLGVPIPSRSMQVCLVSLAEGKKEGYVALEDAAKRARQISRWLESFPAQS